MAVTLRTIAKRVGVSVQAVSYVLNNRDIEMRISSERSAQIRKVARELQYIPNASARAMHNRRTRQIGVLVRVERHGAIVHPRAMETIMGINAGLEPTGNIVVIIPVSGDREADEVESRVFRERLLDGLLFVEVVPEVDVQRAVALVPAAIWVNNNVFGAHNCVRRDEVAVGRTVASELHALGYRRLIFVAKVHSDHYSEADRKAGLEAAARKAGMAVEQQSIHLDECNGRAPAWLTSATHDAAIVASDTYVARLLQAVMGAAGIRPGIDVAVACCDDADEFAWTWPSLARVGFDRYAMGQRAAAMILERVADPRAVVPSESVQGKWIHGSTAPAVRKMQ